MNIDKVSIGVNPPWDINVVIEIPMGGHPVKYEIDKSSGALFVDRFLHTAMYYPANYGFVPHTLSEDGDPIDVMVLGQVPVIPGCVMRSRPVGALVMEDESGPDEKMIAVPVVELHPYYADIASYKDLPPDLLDQISHFFQHYKDLEPTKWVTMGGWRDPQDTARLVEAAIQRAGQ